MLFRLNLNLLQALFDSTIPLRAIYPIELDTDQRIIAVTIFQFVMSIFLIEGIVFFDGIGGQVMSQMTLHFHVLCIEFQRIGSGLVDSPENDPLERKRSSDKIKCDLFKLVKRHQELIQYAIMQSEKKSFDLIFLFSDLDNGQMLSTSRCFWLSSFAVWL